MAMRDTSKRNIKINIDGDNGRTSTTINYVLCFTYFSTLLQLDRETKFEDALHRRKWLTSIVQNWIKTVGITNSSSIKIEERLAAEIHTLAFKMGKESYEKDYNYHLDL